MSQGSFSAWIKTLHNSNGGLQWPFYLGAAAMGFFLKCPTSFYDRPFGFGSLNCTKTRPLLPKGAGALLCSAPFRPAAEGTSAPLLGGKRTAASIVRKPPFAKWTRSWTTARRLFLFCRRAAVFVDSIRSDAGDGRIRLRRGCRSKRSKHMGLYRSKS